MAAVNASAKQTIKAFLDQYGLGALTNWAWGVYTSSGGDLQTGLATINAELPDQAAFKARFPAYQQLAKAGHAMSIQQMLQYEQTARDIMHAAGIPAGFYDTPDDLAKFMVNGVSTTELEARVKDAQQAVLSSAPDVRNQLQNLYGVTPGHLTAYFLNPQVAEPLLAQHFTAAQIATQAQRAGVGQLNVGQAELLTQEGVTDAQAQQGFNQLGNERGLFEAQTTGEQTIGLNTQLGAEFGDDTTAQLAFKRRQAQRQAEFQGQSGFGVGQQGVAGLTPVQRGA